MSSAIYPDPPRLVTAVCGRGEQQRLSNARLRLTFYNAPVAYCGPARPDSAFQQSAVSGLLPRAYSGRRVILQKVKEEIQECYRHADECRQRAEKAFTEKGRQEFIDVERRWLT